MGLTEHQSNVESNHQTHHYQIFFEYIHSGVPVHYHKIDLQWLNTISPTTSKEDMLTSLKTSKSEKINSKDIQKSKNVEN